MGSLFLSGTFIYLRQFPIILEPRQIRTDCAPHQYILLNSQYEMISLKVSGFFIIATINEVDVSFVLFIHTYLGGAIIIYPQGLE